MYKYLYSRAFHVLYTVCSVSAWPFYTIFFFFYIYIHVHLCHASRAYLIYWEDNDSVSVTRRDDMVEQVCEPAVSDIVKIKFQRQVCKGMVAEVGTPEAIKSKEEVFLRREYTPFSRK